MNILHGSSRRLPRGSGRHQVWAVYTINEETVKESWISRHWTRVGARAAAARLNREPAITFAMMDALADGVPLAIDCEVR
jgi:hypothetical protein